MAESAPFRQASRNASASPGPSSFGRGYREAVLIALSIIAIYLVLSLASYDQSDPGWSHSGHVAQILNKGGRAGAWIADVFLYLFGYLAYLLPAMVGYVGWMLYRGNPATGAFELYRFMTRVGGFVFTVAGGSGLATLHFPEAHGVPLDAGGVLGNLVGNGLVSIFNSLGATLFMLALFLTGMTIFTSLSWLALMDTVGRYTLWLLSQSRTWVVRASDYYRGLELKREREVSVDIERKRVRRRKKPRIEPTISTVTSSVRAETDKQVPLFEPPADDALPALSLLDLPGVPVGNVSAAALEALSRQVELKLRDFSIEAEVVAVHAGPVVTRFELQPAPGVKVSRITTLAKDLARSLSTVSVRIVEVIPGKSVVGLEIPNEKRELVCLSEILRSTDYDAISSPLALALGKDIAGHAVVVDLARMPHLLVAGTTGSGKSVALNAMVLSLIYKSVATDVRMIMIDPKMLELSVYDGIPQLLAPVVTDLKDAANALRWCIAEMDRRYRVMSTLGVRNIAGYNRKIKDAEKQGRPIADPTFVGGADLDAEVPMLDSLPFIVVIVDELADLMMVVGKKVEELIARLAQKARAAGIHLILATQRPSVDVITGLIKANIPTRIAFQVSSKIDSRTILDQMGAEQLLGHGDMLYLSPGVPTPIRVHGAFVSDQEVHRVVAALKKRGEPRYVDSIVAGEEEEIFVEGGSFSIGVDTESDPLYDQAVYIVTESRRASISGVQRRLKIGYNRAARIIEHMEGAGIVGPLQSNGSREVIAPPPPE